MTTQADLDAWIEACRRSRDENRDHPELVERMNDKMALLNRWRDSLPATMRTDDMATGPRNITLWIIGPDSAPEAVEVEQTDGKVYPLCTFGQVHDPTSLGWLLSKYAMSDGLDLQFSLVSRVSE